MTECGRCNGRKVVEVSLFGRPPLQAPCPFCNGLGDNEVNDILDERGKRYGEFKGHAEITQAMKDAMRQHANWGRLGPSHIEALEMIAHKIGRIVNGDPNYPDSWDDIAGYATLVSRELKGGEG